MILPPIPLDEQPSKVEVFDKARGRRAKVDLESPFFEIKTPSLRECNHKEQGITLVIATREAFCKCGAKIDLFDALLIYAYAQKRLVNTLAAIKEERQRDADKRERRRFVRGVTSKEQNRFGWRVGLSCGHSSQWAGQKPPRRMTCYICWRAEKKKPKKALCVTDAGPQSTS